MASIGYKMVRKRGHPNAYADGRILEHVFVMSEMLGRALTDLEVVHHKDEDRRNNSPDNLQLFPSQAEHLALHNLLRAKERAFNACGNASFMKCPFCKVYSDPSEMTVRKVGYRAYHKSCNTAYSKTRAQQSIGI